MRSQKDKYIQLCKAEDSIPIFSQPFWLNAVCGEKNWDVILYEKGDKVMASLPYYIKKIYGISYVTQPRFTQILGPWIKYPDNIKLENKLSLEKEVMYALIDQLEKFPICFFQQNFSYKITNWLPFYWRKYKQTTGYTYRIKDISKIDDVLNNFHYSKQKNIKQAQKLNLIIGFDLTSREFYDNHCLTLKKKGKIISYSYNLFEKMYNTVYANNAGRVIYIKDKEENLHSAHFVIWDINSAYDLISTIDPDYMNCRSSTLLLLEIIRYLSDKTKSFDFEGSMIEAVENSFNKFGTIQTPYFIIWKTYAKNPLLKLLIHLKLFKIQR
jgi:hypothetical protein